MKTLSTVISRVFEPMIVLSALLVVAAIKEKIDWRFLLFALVFMVLPVVAMRVWFVRSRGLDWDIRDRSKRIAPLAVLVLIVTLDVSLVSWWHNEFLTRLFLLFLAWTAGYFVITLIWKISGHTSVTTLASLLMVQWYGWWPILLTIPLVAWARIVEKNHTIGQAVGGIVYSWVLHEIWKSVLR